MSQIRQLPAAVVNQIAAGEVIERPASVVKELVENALDAQARRVDVAIEQGGVDLIRVVDDGSGIAADQLSLAIASHATSKIGSADDLFRVASLGFRGEALASIGSVSRLTIRSRTPDAESAARIEVVGGRSDPIEPAAGPRGTLVEVRQLFFNTPVRRKFLRTTQTEAGHVAEAITRLALSHPHVHFTLTHNGRSIYDLPPASLFDRIGQLFGAELAGGLLSIDAADDDIRLFGYAANPSHSRPHNRMQYLMLNGRFIRDRSLQHALGEAYRGLLLTGRYPIAFLTLEIPAASVDVNVHPTKLEVRFQDGGRIYSHLLGSLRTRFLSTDLVARAKVPADGDAVGSASGDESGGRTSGPSAELLRWAQREFPHHDADAPALGRDPWILPHERPEREALSLHPVDPTPTVAPGSGAVPVEGSRPGRGGEWAPADLSESHARWPAANPPGAQRVDSAMPYGAPRPAALQIHNRYLVTETDEGLEIIDQHALHERILYEALRLRALAGGLESQRLLAPEPVDVSASEAAAASEHKELLLRLGLEVEPFGGETLLVSSYPAMLSRFAPAEILRGALEPLTTVGRHPDRRDLLDELLHQMACKAAVKYGDPLTPAEIEALLAQRALAQDHRHCPHGRPTALLFTREQLDRQFKRI